MGEQKQMFYVSSFLEVLIVAGEHIVYSLAAEIFEHCLDWGLDTLDSAAVEDNNYQSQHLILQDWIFLEKDLTW